MSISFVEKEKGLLQTQIEDLKEQIKKLNTDIQNVQNQNRVVEQKLVVSEQLCESLRK